MSEPTIKDGCVAITIPLSITGGELRTLAAIEADVIANAMAHFDGSVWKVAKALGIGRSTIYRRLKLS